MSGSNLRLLVAATTVLVTCAPASQGAWQASEEPAYSVAGAPPVWYRTIMKVDTPYGPPGCAVLYPQESPVAGTLRIFPDRVEFDVRITLPAYLIAPCGIVHDTCYAVASGAGEFQGRCSWEASRFNVWHVGPPILPQIAQDDAIRFEFTIENAVVEDDLAWTYYQTTGVLLGVRAS